MSKARLVITAVTVEKQPVAEVIATYGVSRSWLYELLARYREEGEAAFEPRSRRPHTSPGATDPETVDLVLRLRKDLVAVDRVRHVARLSCHRRYLSAPAAESTSASWRGACVGI